MFKLLPDIIATCDKVDRLAIIVTGKDTENLLGVPKLAKGTGAAMADATVSALKDWNLKEKIDRMCFDTTSSNTCIHTGACTLIEKQLHKNLMYLACWHHMHEIIVSDVFECCFSPTSGGPDGSFIQTF